MTDSSDLADAIREVRLAAARLNQLARNLDGYLPRSIPVEDVPNFARWLRTVLNEAVDLYPDEGLVLSNFGALSVKGTFGNVQGKFQLEEIAQVADRAIQNLVRSMTGFMGEFDV